MPAYGAALVSLCLPTGFAVARMIGAALGVDAVGMLPRSALGKVTKPAAWALF